MIDVTLSNDQKNPMGSAAAGRHMRASDQQIIRHVLFWPTGLSTCLDDVSVDIRSAT